MGCAASVQNLQNMYCGSARWPEMYGRYVEEKFKMPKCSSQVLSVQADGGQTYLARTGVGL